MALPFRLILLMLLFSFTLPAQLKVVKPVKKDPLTVSKLGFGIGRSRSVLFLNRNIKEDNDAHGWNATVVYDLSRLIRLSAEYNWYQPINIRPTWYNVKAHSIEINVNFMSNISGTRARFYPIAGLSYNVFNGFFTGANDHLNLRALYEPETQVQTRWVGLNAGVGAEYFVKFVSIFGEFKMRVGVSEGYNHLTIMDVCLSAGLRFNTRVLAPGQWFKGTRSRYLLRLAPED